MNHWEKKSFFVDVGDATMRGGGNVLKKKIWHTVRDTLEEWTGQHLAECSLYGIRVYKEGTLQQLATSGYAWGIFKLKNSVE